MSETKPLFWDEDEQALAEGAADWAANEHPVAHFRALRDAGQTWDPAKWRELAELGWPAVGTEDLAMRAVLCEALGSTLAGTPLISAWLTADLDPEADHDQGEVRALAWEEPGTRADPSRVSAKVVDGKLTGTKVNVLDPGAATAWLVTAREAGVVGLYRVALEHGTVVTKSRIDHRDAANVSFDGAPAVKIGEQADVERALDRAVVALSAEMLGGASAALKTTIAWVKERKQFDVPIGSFQVIKHRLVDCFMQVELLRSAVIAAAREPTKANCALAKALAGDTYVHVSYEAIQFHGGIGVTDEHDIGFHIKRARVADRLYGTASWHRDRWGRIHGY